MVKYVLKYFPGRGKAEVSRLLFAYAGVEYEDVRIPGSEWSTHKPEAPFGQMPWLEVDGVKMCQSGAIERFLAQEFGLSGKDSKEEYYINMFCACLEDIRTKYPFSEKDEAKKAELLKEFLEVTVPSLLKKVEDLLVKYNGGNGYFTSKLSIADLYLMNFFDFILPKKADCFDSTPKLMALYKRVREEKGIKEWVEKRPKTEF